MVLFSFLSGFPGIPSGILGPEDVDVTANVNNSAEDDNDSNMEDVVADIEQCTGSSSLMQEEEKDTGVVKLHVYKSYWIAVGRILAPMILVSLFLMQGKYTTVYIFTLSCMCVSCWGLFSRRFVSGFVYVLCGNANVYLKHSAYNSI